MAQPSSRTTPDASHRPSVLIVDDNHSNLVTITAVLESLDVDLVCVSSGREALRTLLDRSFALILLDVNMPDLDGFETAGMIRERPTSENTPIIFVTAYGWDDFYSARGYSMGAVDCIMTPIIPDILRSKVSVFVELFRQAEQLRRQSQRLEQRSLQLSALANQLTEAEHRERQRIARVLHDHLQQLLVAAKMRLAAAGSKSDTRGDRLLPVADLLDEAIDASRSLAVELSPPILQDHGLGRAMEDLAKRFRKNHGLAVQLKLEQAECRLPEHIYSFVYQATREMLFNVVKHAGVPEASLMLETVDGCLYVTVEDSGAGFVAEPTLNSNARGDHFGLASIRERLLQLNASLKVDTRKGQGTRLTMSIPVHRAPARPIEPAPARTLNDRPQRQGATGQEAIRILLVDDHAVFRKGMIALLEAHEGLNVVGEAVDGEKAVQAAREMMPDVVVMDMSMPVLNGIEATRQIVSALPETIVIGLSTYDGTEVPNAFYEAGAVSYFRKDAPPDRIVAAIRTARSVATKVS